MYLGKDNLSVYITGRQEAGYICFCYYFETVCCINSENGRTQNHKDDVQNIHAKKLIKFVSAVWWGGDMDVPLM